jgi:3',5'-cyclic AMP phosphodiesterase CpdA
MSTATDLENASRTDVLAPLRFFYGLSSQDLRVSFVQPEEMPDDARWLLAHETDMTPRLAGHHHCGIGLDVHAKSRLGNYLVRASVLRRETDGAPVEFGAIGIHLNGFSEDARRLVLEGHVPLGGILQRLQVPHTSHPSGYFRIVIDHRLANLLGGWEGQALYGRCNELRHPNGEPLAEVVEVLPDGAA